MYWVRGTQLLMTAGYTSRYFRQWRVGPSSLTILGEHHFLLTNLRRVRPTWIHWYETNEFLYRPPLGPVRIEPITGELSVTICSGRYLRRVFMSREEPRQFRVSKREILARLPEGWEVAGGFGVGVYHIPGTSYPLSVFSFFNASEAVSSHPFRLRLRGGPQGCGSLLRSLEGVMEPGTLDVDEGEGRLAYLMQTPSGEMMVNIIDLV
ncbi:hypothetical protein B0H16DRAFT_1495568 [Mycena metata]|uniref:Uncharacterized protein n=1 Tax=Mycena metata TaxID=1033252 RepID=A0AAD7P0B6_9AGAR|nr:hypothetical protein B0H16DRAFT_1495568 [Mycena metata]